MTDYLIQPRDPLMFRDGRPFAADPGAQAESLPIPYPSTLAGALRTLAGNAKGVDWSKAHPEVLNLKTKGPLLVAKLPEEDWQVYLPAPADAVVYEDKKGEKRVMRLSPWELPDGAGCNPARYQTKYGESSCPIPFGKDSLLPVQVTEDAKPAKGYDYWSLDDVSKWLFGSSEMPVKFLGQPQREDRTHLEVDSGNLTNKDGSLFTTESIGFNDWADKNHKDRDGKPYAARALLANVDGWEALPKQTFFTLGGERRLSRLASDGTTWPVFPEKEWKDRCKKDIKRLKLQLVTPAPFAHGWKPDFIQEKLTGSIPNGYDWESDRIKYLDKKVKLVSACVPRRQAVSGFSRTSTDGSPSAGPALRGAKAARYLVPAGAVFFFEIVDGTITVDDMKSLWLNSICGGRNDRGDGFGLAVPGVWDYAGENQESL